MAGPEARPAGVDTMSGSDTLLWTIGADPVMRPTIVALVTLDGTPVWSEVYERVGQLTQSVPRLRSRVVAPGPGPGRPRFVVDPTFELDSHLRHLRLPAHGTLRDVLDLAQTMATSGFDTALPVWEAVLIDGVEAEPGSLQHSVLVMKVHHALIDGVGGLAVLGQLFDAGGPGPSAQPSEGDAHRPDPSHGRCTAQANLWGAARHVGDAIDAAVHPLRTAGRLAGLGTSVLRLMAPAFRPVSPLMTERTFRRRVEVLDLELATLKDAAARWDGTVNDIFVASVVRGLTRYHEQHGVHTTGLRALMPVNVRDPGDTTKGNHFVPARFVIPVHANVADCVLEVSRRAEQWKHAPGLSISDVLATALSTLPPPLARGLWSSLLLGNDFCVTDVPGPPSQPFLTGVGVTGIYAVSPPSGAACNVSLVSVGEHACVTINVDVAAVPDSPKLARCVEDGFAEVCPARPAS